MAAKTLDTGSLIRRAVAAAAVAIAAFGAGSVRADARQSLQALLGDPDYVEIGMWPGVIIRLRYASADNFLNRDVYGDFNRAFLHRVAADKLRHAGQALARDRPGWKIVVYDALRPRSVQRVLWDTVQGTQLQRYVANPETGSIHNFGLALDVTLADATGGEVDMGTTYDAFQPLAQPALEQRFLREGKLTAAQLQNRSLLRRIMTDAGFIQLPLEWWHFDALPQAEVRAKFKIVE
jgi:D-alanyl-D-alanine dipeptidase